MLSNIKIFIRSILLITIFSCLLNSQTLEWSPQSGKKLTDSVSLQLKWKHQFQFAGYYAALYKGFYAEEGLAVKILEGNRQEDPVRKVLSGEAEFGISDVDILYFRLLGQPLVTVAAIFQHSHHIFLTKKSSGIRKASDLIGKKVMISNYIGVAQLKSIFKREGIPIKSINIISDHWNFDALIKDSVDMLTAYITDHPYKLEKLGIEPYILHSEDYGIDFYGDMLFTSDKMVAENPELVKKFRRATIRGWEYAVTHAEELADYILTSTNASKRGLDRDRLLHEAEYIKKIVLFGYVDIGHLNPGRLESMARILKEMGMAPENYSLDGFIFDPESRSTERLFRVIGIIAGILLLIFGFSAFIIYQLRKMVKSRTLDLEEEIKHRKEFEDILKQSEARYKSLFEYSPLCILEQDFSGVKSILDEIQLENRDNLKLFLLDHPEIILKCQQNVGYVDINHAALEYFGITNKQDYLECKEPYFELLSPDSFIDHLVSIANNESFYETEISFRLKNGEIKNMILRSSLEADSERNYKKTLISLIDITERKKIEEALLDSEKKFRTLYLQFQSILDAVPDAIIVLSPDHKIIWMNYFAEHVLKYKIEKKNESYCCEILFAQDLPCDFCLIESSVENRKSYSREFTTADGKIWEMRTVPILDDQNAIMNVIILIRDTTLKKKAEEEMFRKEKIESVGVLAGGIAHDFNNLLTAVLGNISLSKLMVGKGKDEKIEKYLSTAEKATMRAKDLTYQLLTFSRGGAPIKKKTSLKDIIRDSANFVLRGSKNKLVTDLPDDLWAVEVDEGQISQVIQNLVINADQAMNIPGNITISAENISNNIEISDGLPRGYFVKVIVMDEGSGIPDDLKSKIFDPYFTTKSHGNGLGLATSYSIIKKHQGYITVDSEIGKGSIFTFYIPAVTNIETNIEESHSELIQGKGKVLIVDDEEMVRELLADILLNLGYTVKSCAEGDSALIEYKQSLNTEPFDLVITDLTIPGGMGGKDLLVELLKIDANAKVIVSSGYSNDPLMSDFRKHGFKAVISKPYIVEDLSKTISVVLKN